MTECAQGYSHDPAIRNPRSAVRSPESGLRASGEGPRLPRFRP